MSPDELEATFAARGHTVDYLVKSLRDQIHSGTLSSFVITGPRGAGKSTVIQMVALRIRQDAELRAAWLPVVFPEEQFDIVSLRDLLAAVLRTLAKDGVAAAQEWLAKVEAETNDEQSQQLAITGLREVTRKEGRRLVLFVENLDTLLEDGLDDQMKGTLRRLLMTDPVMMVIGSAVHIFDSLKDYDEAFFNYFGQVPLDRLDTEQVIELLRRRATFDGNEPFLRDLPNQLAKVRAIVHLSGGNPRFILMLYELLSQRQVTTIVQYLRRLVDELTPLLKDEMENLPAQQRKIIHALMEKGGTAQPTDLTGPTRLPLNAITTQLKRLKDAQIVEVLGGGKGRAANYTVPDKLFSIWYQMRYLSQNRRRIELFVEVLRIWFEEEERLQRLRSLADKARQEAPLMLRDSATEAEYLAASLKGTRHESLATELCIDQWIKADLREAAMAFATLRGDKGSPMHLDEIKAHAELGAWLADHGDGWAAIAALNEVIAKSSGDPVTLSNAVVNRGVAKGRLSDLAGAIGDFTRVIGMEHAPNELRARAFSNRGITNDLMGNATQAIDDYTAAIELEHVSRETIAIALLNRGVLKYRAHDLPGAIKDYTAVLELDGAPTAQVFDALCKRGIAKDRLGLLISAVGDFTAAAELEGAPPKHLAVAWLNRGFARLGLDDMPHAISDFSAVIEHESAQQDDVAGALFCRGVCRLRQADQISAIKDFKMAMEAAVWAPELLHRGAEFAFRILWRRNSRSEAAEVMQKFLAALAKLPGEHARDLALQIFSSLAAPEMKEGWIAAWSVLAETEQAEVKEALQFLEPVAKVLAGEDRTLLDALPPEQREFANQVLARFEAKPTW